MFVKRHNQLGQALSGNCIVHLICMEGSHFSELQCFQTKLKRTHDQNTRHVLHSSSCYKHAQEQKQPKTLAIIVSDEKTNKKTTGPSQVSTLRHLISMRTGRQPIFPSFPDGDPEGRYRCLGNSQNFQINSFSFLDSDNIVVNWRASISFLSNNIISRYAIICAKNAHLKLYLPGTSKPT